MTESTIPRWRLAVFGLLLVVLLVLQLGARPERLAFVVTAFGEFPQGAGASHEIHFLAQGVLAWVTIAAIAVQVWRPVRRVGAAWAYTAGTVLPFGTLLALGDVPAEVRPVIAVGIAVAVLAFVLHPASWRAKLAPPVPLSRALLGLVAVGAVPFVVYAVGQLGIHTSSGAGDEHHEFGHWIIMGVYGLLVPLLGLVAARGVPGWRFAAWSSGLMAVALGVGSLAIVAASQLSTVWAVLAILWGVALIGLGEVEARRQREPARAVAGELDDVVR